MGEYAEMILEGLLDEETGEYIGEANKKLYGSESTGFPVSYERQRRERRDAIKQAGTSGKVACPECGKRVKAAGLVMHKRDVHGIA